MNLIATFGLAFLLVVAKPTGTPAAILILQGQGASSAQDPPEQKPTQGQSESEPEHGGSTAAEPANSNSQKQPAAAAVKNTKAKPGSSRKRKKPPASAAAKPNQSPDNPPAIVVVRNGGSSETQGEIASGTTVQQAPQQMKETNSLLNATTLDLEKITGKQLNPNQQGMVKQIRDYMQQSKSAARAGDVQGANNLAFKAHLLSQELIKH